MAAACTAPDAVLVGFGEKTSIFSHAAKLIGANEFGAAEVWSAIERQPLDAELKAAHGLDNEEDLIMPKLMLLHAMLNRLGASRCATSSRWAIARACSLRRAGRD